MMKNLRTFVGLVALCAALGTTAATSTSLAVHAPNIRLRAGTSTNWSGYAAAGAPGSFQNVSASWTQPAVTCTAQTAYSAYWVGLDGDTTSTVEQLGTEADCVGGVARYSSWYEMYPHRSFPATVAVVPGHTYHASVVAQGNGRFLLSLQDTTTGATFTTTQKLMQAKLASAEAIVEAPSGGGVLPLANFGTAQFSGVTANGATMNSPPADQITMVNSSGTIKAQPSALSGGNFSVTWQSAS
jgi:hypothetical protein